MEGVRDVLASLIDIERAPDGHPTAIQHVRVDHRGLHTFVSQKLLDGSDIVPGLDQVGREAMSESVTACAFNDAASANCDFDRSLHGGGRSVVSAQASLSPVNRHDRRWEHVLPSPRSRGIGIFSRQRIRECGFAQSLGEIFPMHRFDRLKVQCQGTLHRGWKDCASIPIPFSRSYKDLPRSQVDVLYPQAQGLRQA